MTVQKMASPLPSTNKSWQLCLRVKKLITRYTWMAWMVQDTQSPHQKFERTLQNWGTEELQLCFHNPTVLMEFYNRCKWLTDQHGHRSIAEYMPNKISSTNHSHSCPLADLLRAWIQPPTIVLLSLHVWPTSLWTELCHPPIATRSWVICAKIKLHY